MSKEGANTAASVRLVRLKRESRTISTLKLALTWLLLLLIALFFVQTRIDFIRTEQRVKALMVEKRRLTSSILPLQLEERHLTRFAIIEDAAMEAHQLQYPRASQIINMPIPKSAE
jgi:cell division protein FtsL